MDLTLHVHHTIEFNGVAVWALVLILAVLVATGVLCTFLPLYALHVPEQPKEPFGFKKQ